MSSWWDRDDGKGDGGKGPGFGRSRMDTMNRKNIFCIKDYRPGAPKKGSGDDEIVVSTDADVEGVDGVVTRQVSDSMVVAADGRMYSATDFGGFSWTNEWSPAELLVACLNPFEHHGQRLVFVGVDGGVTDAGNVLCGECFEHNKGRQALKDGWLTLRGLLYSNKFEVF